MLSRVSRGAVRNVKSMVKQGGVGAARVVVPRRFLSALVETKPKPEEKKPEEEEDTSFLAKYGGKIAMAAMALSGVLLYRYFKSNSLRSEVEEDLIELTVLEPYEIHDLRVSNEISAADFDAISARMFELFPSQELTYDEFIGAVSNIVRQKFNRELKHMHYFDRLVMGSTQVPGSKTLGEDATKAVVPLRRLLVAFSTVVNAVADERIVSLDRLMRTSLSKMDHQNLSSAETVLLIDDLARTWQIPGDRRTIENEKKPYPAQHWRVRTAEEILLRFKTTHTKELAAKEKPDEFSTAELDYLLKSGSVCAWGECYRRS
jgi:hypothetical protein